MKKITLLSAAVLAYCILQTASCFSQGTAINSTGAKADSSAMLDISSTSKGMLVPRMLKAEKLAVSNPASGLLIYQTNDTTGFWYFNGIKWVQAIGPAGPAGSGLCSHTIGESFGGGKIFFTDASGCRGFISATTDQSALAVWTNISSGFTGAYSYDGLRNTAGIIAQGAVTGAAKICDTLNLSGYSDWFLPSKEEMAMMFMQKTMIGGFAAAEYWNSTETNGTFSWTQDFSTGSPYGRDKDGSYRVRCIRKF